MKKTSVLPAAVFLTMMGAVCLAGEAKSPAVMLQEAIYAEETEGDLDKAIEIYSQILEQYKEVKRVAARATYQLGMCSLKKGDNKKAGEYFQQVVDYYPEQTSVVQKAQQQIEKMGITTANQDDTKNQSIQELTHDDSNSAGRESIAGSGHVVKFQVSGGDCFLRAVKIYGSRYGYDQPPNEYFHIYLCNENFEAISDFPFPYAIFQKGNKDGNPRGWVTLKIEPATKVPATFFVCVDFKPEQTKGIYVHHDAANSGNSFIAIPGQPLTPADKQGDWMIRAIVEQSSENSSKQNKLQAEDLTVQGWKLWQERKLPEAEEKFKKAIELNPQSENAYQGLGWAQLNQGKKLNAEESFKKCVELNSKNSAALNGLGWIAHGQGNIDSAVEWWKKAVEASNGQATASISGLAQVYMEKGDYENAAMYYQMWLKVEPNNEDAKKGLKQAKGNLK